MCLYVCKRKQTNVIILMANVIDFVFHYIRFKTKLD